MAATEAPTARLLEGAPIARLIRARVTEDVQAFARVLTEDLRSVSKDRHIRVIYGPEIVKRVRGE